jgi:hypothetical protein
MSTVLTGEGVKAFQLLAWKYAIQSEQRGMRHSSGRSVRKFAAECLGLPSRSKPEVVIAKIEERLLEIEQHIHPERF